MVVVAAAGELFEGSKDRDNVDDAATPNSEAAPVERKPPRLPPPLSLPLLLLLLLLLLPLSLPLRVDAKF
jgi:hypothetical protein